MLRRSAFAAQFSERCALLSCGCLVFRGGALFAQPRLPFPNGWGGLVAAERRSFAEPWVGLRLREGRARRARLRGPDERGLAQLGRRVHLGNPRGSFHVVRAFYFSWDDGNVDR